MKLPMHISLRKHTHAIHRNFLGCKKSKISLEFFFYIFLIFAHSIDCGYALELEPPHRGGSNEYPQSLFWSKNKKNKKNMYTPACPSFSI